MATLLPAACLLAASALSTAPLAAPPASRPVLVTVDDLPITPTRLHPEDAGRERVTRGLLNALARHRIRAVGLVTWGNVRSEADRKLLELWLEAGHELGNHSDRHPSLTRLEAAAYIEDIERARSQLAALLSAHGKELRFFRYPMLREGETAAKRDAVRAYLVRTGQRNLPVTLDNQDWSFEELWVEATRKGDAAAQERIAAEYHEALRVSIRHHERLGDELFGRPLPQILLLHAGSIGTAQWDALFSWLTGTGHRFATSDEVLSVAIFLDDPGSIGTHGPGLWERWAAVRREEQATEEILRLFFEQTEAWNRGDLEAFCSVYAEDATFISPSGRTGGRQAVLDRYRSRYPDQAAMGRLSLEVDEIRFARGTEVSMLGDARPSRVHGASVVARWRLSREQGEDTSGLTLIVLRPTPDGWRIVQDASM